MSDFGSKEEWEELMAVYESLVGAELDKVKEQYFFRRRDHREDPSIALRNALLICDKLLSSPNDLTSAAKEYDEIQTGADIWASIQKNSAS
jgi:hypothetical protein